MDYDREDVEEAFLLTFAVIYIYIFFFCFVILNHFLNQTNSPHRTF